MKHLLPFALLLLSCSKEAPTPKPIPELQEQLQGDWIPASDIEWTFYNSNAPGPVRYLAPSTTNQYTFQGDTAYVYTQTDSVANISRFGTREAEGKSYLYVYNDFQALEGREFEVTVQGDSMKWLASYRKPIMYKLNGNAYRTDSSKVEVSWVRLK